jgi:hypothetical protein
MAPKKQSKKPKSSKPEQTVPAATTPEPLALPPPVAAAPPAPAPVLAAPIPGSVPALAPAPIAAVPTATATAGAHGTDVMNQVASIVETHLNGMKEGEKITLKDLSKKVFDQTGLVGSIVTPVISLLTKTWPGITIEKGRFGGIYKGGRAVTAKKPDDRERCQHCKQVIRTKPTGPRKKKKKEGEADAANGATGTTAEAGATTPAPPPSLEQGAPAQA